MDPVLLKKKKKRVEKNITAWLSWMKNLQLREITVGLGQREGKKHFLFVLLSPLLQKIGLDKLQISVITKMKSNMLVFLIGLFVYITNHSDQNYPFCHNVCFV